MRYLTAPLFLLVFLLLCILMLPFIFIDYVGRETSWGDPVWFIVKKALEDK